MVSRFAVILSCVFVVSTALTQGSAAQSETKPFVQSISAADNVALIVSRNAETQRVQHLGGQTDVALHPLRIVSLHNVFSEALTALDIVPLGAVERPEGAVIQLKSALADTHSVGNPGNPDYEAILALQPDLILSAGEAYGQNYDLLQAIAPTIVLHEPDADWRPWFNGLAAIFDRSAKAQAVIASYDQKADKIRQQLQQSHADETVLLLRVRQKDIRVYGTGRRAGPVLYNDLQMTPHRLVPIDQNYQPISSELIAQMDADRIFLMVEDEEKLGNVEKSTLWQSLPAVKAGRVYRVNIQPWNQSSGPLSAGIILDDVAAAFGLHE